MSEGREYERVGTEHRDALGRFKKGNPNAWQEGESGNPGGRVKGISIKDAINAVSTMTRKEVYRALNDDELPMAVVMALHDWLNSLDNDSKSASLSRDRLLARIDGPVRAEESGDQHEQPAAQVRVIVERGMSVKEEEEESDE